MTFQNAFMFYLTEQLVHVKEKCETLHLERFTVTVNRNIKNDANNGLYMKHIIGIFLHIIIARSFQR